MVCNEGVQVEEDCAVSATHRVSSTEFSTMKDVTYSAMETCHKMMDACDAF